MVGNIILVGYMGSGKTSMARLLGQHFNMQVVDIDFEIEKSEGLSVNQLFKEKGEEYFRELESSIIQSRSWVNTVIATGGGLPCFNNNMGILNELGKTIYLKITPKEVRRRVTKSKNKRPLLSLYENGEELLNYIENSLKEREVFYNSAHITIDANDYNKEDVLDKILERLT